MGTEANTPPSDVDVPEGLWLRTVAALEAHRLGRTRTWGRLSGMCVQLSDGRQAREARGGELITEGSQGQAVAHPNVKTETRAGSGRPRIRPRAAVEPGRPSAARDTATARGRASSIAGSRYSWCVGDIRDYVGEALTASGGPLVLEPFQIFIFVDVRGGPGRVRLFAAERPGQNDVARVARFFHLLLTTNAEWFTGAADKEQPRRCSSPPIYSGAVASWRRCVDAKSSRETGPADQPSPRGGGGRVSAVRRRTASTRLWRCSIGAPPPRIPPLQAMRSAVFKRCVSSPRSDRGPRPRHDARPAAPRHVGAGPEGRHRPRRVGGG